MRRSIHFSIGLITLAFVAFGLVRVILLLQRDPTEGRFSFSVLFKDAQGLRAGTDIVYRGIPVGEVASLDIDATGRRVRALLELDPELTQLAATTTQIWIVRPRFSGLAGDLSGLDTLIKESYLRIREKDGGELLRPGDELLGLETPPDDLVLEELEDPETGDLVAGVLLPERHNLGAGDPVLYRGLRVGDVRSVHVTKDGRGVLLRFRIRRLYRSLVLESSRFWSSRPRLHGSLLSGITIDDLGSLIAPALVFDSPPGKASLASDQTVFIGMTTPPDTEETWRVDPEQSPEVRAEPRELRMQALAANPWVKVHYQAREVDWLSRDDKIETEGEGILYQRGPGDFTVITNRTCADGTVIADEGFFDSTSIRDERIRVVLEDGRVFPGRRAWTSDVHDLALVHIQVPEGVESFDLPKWDQYLSFLAEDVDSAGDVLGIRVLQDTKCVGILGHPDFDLEEEPVRISLSHIPESFRPKEGEGSQ